MRQALLSALLLGLLPACGDTQPAWCEAQGAPDTACAGPQCVAAVIVDYQRLEPRGYQVFALSGEPVADGAAAEVLALAHLEAAGVAEVPDQTDCSEALDFYNCFLSYDVGDSWLVVLHAPTSAVLFAGLEVWASEERGADLPLPSGFQDASPLGCSDGALDPQRKRLITTGIPLSSTPTTPAEAWAVAQRLNVTEQFTAGHTYRTMVVSYAPAIGEFDATAADWLVWLTRD